MLMRSLRYTAKLTATAAVTLTTCYAIARDMIVHDTLLTVAVAILFVVLLVAVLEDLLP